MLKLPNKKARAISSGFLVLISKKMLNGMDCAILNLFQNLILIFENLKQVQVDEQV